MTPHSIRHKQDYIYSIIFSNRIVTHRMRWNEMECFVSLFSGTEQFQWLLYYYINYCAAVNADYNTQRCATL